MVNLTGHGSSIYEISKSASILTHFLQKDHTDSKKDTPPNNITPYELMGVNYIYATTLATRSNIADSKE